MKLQCKGSGGEEILDFIFKFDIKILNSKQE